MEVRKGEIQVQYNLNSIEILGINMDCPSREEIDIKKFGFKINIEQSIDNGNKNIILLIEISISTDDYSINLGSFKSSYVYEIKNFEFFYDTLTDSAEFPDSFYRSLHATTISTSRGIMFSMLKGTFLHKAILPIIHSKDLIQVKKTFSKR